MLCKFLCLGLLLLQQDGFSSHARLKMLKMCVYYKIKPKHVTTDLKYHSHCCTKEEEYNMRKHTNYTYRDIFKSALFQLLSIYLLFYSGP